MKSLKRIILEEWTSLNEMGQIGQIFHFANLRNIKEILKSNRINFSTHLGTGADDRQSKGFYFLSLSRTKSAQAGYGRGQAGTSQGFPAGVVARINFDHRKLRSKFKSAPVDYWQRKDIEQMKKMGLRPDDIMHRMMRDFEYEDRLFSDKPILENASQYITSISIHIPKDFEYGYQVRDILRAAQERNIQVYVYGNINDFNYERTENNINDKFVNAPDEVDPYNPPERGVDKDFLYKVLALVLYDSESARELNSGALASKIHPLIKQYNVPIEPDESFVFKVWDYMKSLQYLWPESAGFVDYLSSISADIHNLSKSGRSSPDRQTLFILSTALKRSGIKTIKDYVLFKVLEMKPPNTQKFNWANTHSIKIGNSIIDNTSPMKSVYQVNPFSLRGHVFKADEDFIYNIYSNNKPIGELVNYLMNKYTDKKVSSIIKIATDNEGEIVKGVREPES